MSEAWNALQFDFDEKEVPNSLKKDVMDYVFKTADNGNASRKSNSWIVLFKKQFSPLASGLLLLFTVVTIILALNNHSLQQSPERMKEGNSAPTQILKTFSIQAADLSNKQLTGFAAVIQEGHSKKLIVQVENLPQVKGSEVYQVWLLKSGKRTNAGIFRPNGKGTGMLSFQLGQNSGFDQIGITIEPDGNSLQPQGKKIAGAG